MGAAAIAQPAAVEGTKWCKVFEGGSVVTEGALVISGAAGGEFLVPQPEYDPEACD